MYVSIFIYHIYILTYTHCLYILTYTQSLYTQCIQYTVCIFTYCILYFLNVIFVIPSPPHGEFSHAPVLPPKILKKHPNNFCAATFTSTTSASSDTKISSQRPLVQSTWSFILFTRWRFEGSMSCSELRASGPFSNDAVLFGKIYVPITHGMHLYLR